MIFTAKQELTISEKKELFRQCCELEGVTVKKQHRHKENGIWKNTKQVALGLKRC